MQMLIVEYRLARIDHFIPRSLTHERALVYSRLTPRYILLTYCTAEPAASLVAVRPVLGLEGETVGDLAQEHLCEKLYTFPAALSF